MQVINRFITPLLWLLSLLGMITAGMFLYQVIRYSNNAPMGDDIELIVTNTIAIINAHSVSELLSSFLTQNSEHRPAILPLIGLLSYVVYGQISLPFINILSAVLLLASLFTILYSVSPSRIEIVWMAAWALPLAAAPLHYECIPWASCSASHYTVAAFGVLAIFFATQVGWWAFIAFEIASIMALLSLFCGLLALVLGGVAIYLRPEPLKQKRLFLCLHTVITILIIYFYFVDLDLINKYLPLEVVHFGADPLGTLQQALIWVFAWPGSWLDFDTTFVSEGWTYAPIATPWTAICIGVGEFLAIAVLAYRYRFTLLNRHLQVTLTIVYFLCAIIVAAVQRSMILSLPYIFTSRYRVYTVFLIISVLVLLFTLLRENSQRTGSTARYKLLAAMLSVACLLFYVRTYQQFTHHLDESLDLREHCINEWNAHGIAEDCWWKGDWKIMLDKAVSTQLFRIEH